MGTSSASVRGVSDDNTAGGVCAAGASIGDSARDLIISAGVGIGAMWANLISTI